MAGELWTSALSLVGVALGGGLASLTQRAAQRSTERAEERRQASARAEARRAEQLQTLTQFIGYAQDAEKAAYDRPVDWAAGDVWHGEAKAAMSGLWIAERSILLLCPTVVHSPATAYARALNHAVWRELGETTVTDHLEQHKGAFLSAARDSLA